MQPARKNVLTFGVVNAPVGVCSARASNQSGQLKMVAPFERDAKGNLPARATRVEQRYLDPTSVRYVKAEREDMVPLSALYTKAQLEDFRAVERGVDPRTGETVYQPVDARALNEAAERLDSMEVLGFVAEKDAAAYHERIYDAHYLQPQNGTPAKPLALLGAAMRAERVAGVVKFSVGARERAGLVRARPDGSMVVLSVAFAERWKDPDEAVLSPALVKPDRRELALARDLVRALTVDASLLDDLRDETRARQDDVIAKVLAGEVPGAETRVAAEGPDFAELLEASVERARKRQRKVAA